MAKVPEILNTANPLLQYWNLFFFFTYTLKKILSLLNSVLILKTFTHEVMLLTRKPDTRTSTQPPADFHHYNKGPVVQSVVSLTSSLRVISLIVLAASIYNTLIFFAEKMYFLSKKFQHICVSLNVNFNESLTNDVVSFEHLGPEFSIGKPA